MSATEIIIGSKQEPKLEIVWRNADRRSNRRRRHTFEPDGEHTRYLLQEYVADGYFSYWMTLSSLVVLAGGRAA
jgi:hypothetical protein